MMFGAPHDRHRSRWFLRLLVASIAVVGVLPGRPSVAQPADWSVDGGGERREEIIRRYRAILERRPEQGPILDRLLEELGGGDRFERAVDDYRRLSEEEPTVFAYPMLLGHLLVHAQRLQAAREAYESAIAVAPDDARGHVALGAVLRTLDLRDDATATYEHALTLAADQDEQRTILRALADLAFDAREWDIASSYVQRLIELDPDDTYTRLELAGIFVRYERYDEALTQYQIIADEAGRDTRRRAIATKEVGDVLLLMGRSEEALDAYRRAMRLVDEGHWLRRELEQRIIEAYRHDDRLDELVAEYEEEWRSPNLRQLMLLAELYDELGREEDAIDVLRRALRRDSRSIDARQALIRALERRGDTDAVLDEYRTLVRQVPDDAAFRFRLIEVYRRSGDREAAIEELRRMARRFDDVPHVLVDVAERYLRFGERDSALEAYERLVRIDPSEPDNYVALGEFHFMDGRRSEAERTWRRILDLGGDAAAAHAMLGSVFADHGLLEEAIDEYSQARGLEPEDDRYLRELARLYDDARELPEALALWTDLLDRTDQTHLRAEARTAVVRIHAALGRLQEVIPTWNTRFQADTPDIEAGYLLGEAYLQLDDEQRAEEAYLALREHDDGDLIALQALERLYSTQNRVTEAIEVLVRIAEINPGRAREYYHRLAELSLRVYDDAAAVDFARVAVQLNPDDAQAQARLGDIYRQMQRLEDAVLAYRQALLLDPRAFVHYFDLAEILLALDRPSEADQLYRRVLVEANDEVQVLRAGRRSLQINQATGRLQELAGLIEPRLYHQQVGETCLKLLVGLYERLTMPLIQAAEYGLPAERERARARLEEIGRRALRPLLDALAGEDLTVRTTALRILAAQRNPNAALPIARLLDESDPGLRMAAAFAVARIADPRATQPLIRALESGSPSLQLVAAWALGRIGSTEALDALAETAVDGGAPDRLRALATIGLGRASAGAAPRRAVGAALFDESARVQFAALVAAGALGLDERAPDIRLLLQHGRNDVPRAAAWALGGLSPSGPNVSALAEAYVVGTPEIRTDAGRALARVGRGVLDEEARRRFEEAMPFVDRRADVLDVDAYLHGLLDWQLLGVDIEAPVVLAAHDAELARVIGVGLGADLSTRLRLLGELDAHAGRLVVGVVSASMAGADDAEHHAFVRAVVEPHAATLIALAVDPDPRIRRVAVSVVSKIGGADSLAAVRNALTDEDTDVVAAAIEGLGRVGDAADIDAVVAFAADERWPLRSEAVAALGLLGGAVAEEAVAEALFEDPYVAVQIRAAAALASLSPERAGVAFIERWDTAATPVRIAMLRATPALSGAAIRDLRERALGAPDPRVRALGEGLPGGG